MRLGAHVGTVGGVSTAPAQAASIGADAMQIFTRNQRRWRVPSLAARQVELFRTEVAAHEISPVISHASYLLNLASRDAAVASATQAALVDEIRRASALGIRWLVVHPGAHRGAGTAEGVATVAETLDRCLGEAGVVGVSVALETTAGSGTTLGATLGELGDILGAARRAADLGVCLDTCHLHAAGYDVVSAAGYEALVAEVERTVGLIAVGCWHLNDTASARGSHRDRHAPVGEGLIGLDALRRIVHDPRWAALGGCLETPGGPDAWRREIAALRLPPP
jgi:deoxyribonuclease-4